MKRIFNPIILLCSLSLASIHAMEETTLLEKIWSALNAFCNQDITSAPESLNKEEIRSKKYLLFTEQPLNQEKIVQYLGELIHILECSILQDADKIWLEKQISEIKQGQQ